MTTWEMVKIVRDELKPGIVLQIRATGDGSDGVMDKYEIKEVYPHIVLTERNVKGGKIRRSFSLWTALKAIGKVQNVNLCELDCREKKKDSAATHARSLLEEESFRETCELHAAGKISQRNAAEKCNISQTTFVKYYAQYMAQKKLKCGDDFFLTV